MQFHHGAAADIGELFLRAAAVLAKLWSVELPELDPLLLPELLPELDPLLLPELLPELDPLLLPELLVVPELELPLGVPELVPELPELDSEPPPLEVDATLDPDTDSPTESLTAVTVPATGEVSVVSLSAF